MAFGLITGLTACEEKPDDNPTPAVTISLRSCSIVEGAEYVASELTSVTLSYNNVVAVSPSAAITLNGTACAAASGATTAMDVVITLPALEEGKAYTLTVPEGAIVGKEDPVLESAFKIVRRVCKAGKLPAVLSSPKCGTVLELAFPATPHSVVVWDDVRQDVPTFEPVFPRTQLDPGKSVEFVMQATLKKK